MVVVPFDAGMCAVDVPGKKNNVCVADLRGKRSGQVRARSLSIGTPKSYLENVNAENNDIILPLCIQKNRIVRAETFHWETE